MGWKGSESDLISKLKQSVMPIAETIVRQNLRPPHDMPEKTWAKVVEKKIEKALIETLKGTWIFPNGSWTGTTRIPAHKQKTPVKRAMASFAFDQMPNPAYDSDDDQ